MIKYYYSVCVCEIRGREGGRERETDRERGGGREGCLTLLTLMEHTAAKYATMASRD